MVNYNLYGAGWSGDAFGVSVDEEGVVRFITVVPPGVPLGIEKRGDYFFADTQPMAVSILAIGGGDVGLESSQEDHRWHVFDETLEPQDMHTSASGLSSALLSYQKREFKARTLMFPIAEIIGSTVEQDVLAGAPRRQQIINRLALARDNAKKLGKTLVVGWIQMDLLDGAPHTPQATAREHYGMVGNGLRLEAAETTGQAAPPVLIVNQGFGTRADGCSEVILAEGRLDWDFFSLGFIVPTPLYPFELMPDMLATLTTQSLLMVREIEALAIAEHSAGRDWYCPSLEEAQLEGKVVKARFASLAPLVFQDAENHGFSFAEQDAPQISTVAAEKNFVVLHLKDEPKGPLTLQYAFGQRGERDDGYAANRGSLTDTWERASESTPGKILRRFARSGQTPVRL